LTNKVSFPHFMTYSKVKSLTGCKMTNGGLYRQITHTFTPIIHSHIHLHCGSADYPIPMAWR